MGEDCLRRRVAVGIAAMLASLLLSLATARPADAVPAHLRSFEATYPDAVGSRIDTCSLCHSSGSARNPYGAAYKSAGHQFAAIEPDDSLQPALDLRTPLRLVGRG